ncbi:MAG: glycosyltransferase [Candidatus Gottesmanbacteria bacterium]|nr:glycosyltransferase [Candidatus Gottesmanbacteria bacterium]
MKVVVIIPTYNERENIIILLDRLETVFRGFKRHTVSYLVVDDTSPDGTQELVKEYQKTHKSVYLITGKKEGLGKALLRCMTYAVTRLNADILLQMDADLSHDPAAAPEFLRAIDNGADFVIGSRYIPGGSIFTDRLFGHSKIAPAEYIFNIYSYIAVAKFREIVTGSFGKFLVVGGIGFILNAVILILLHNVNWSATWANLVGAAIAIFSNFNLNNIWTFRHQKISGIGQYLTKLAQFYATSAFGVVVIQTGTIWAGIRLVGDRQYFLFFLVGTALLLVWNYVIYSKVIWKK